MAPPPLEFVLRPCPFVQRLERVQRGGAKWALCDLAATSLSVGQSVPTSQGRGVGLPGKAPWKTQAELADGQGLSSAVRDLVLLGSPASPGPSAQTAGYAGMSQGRREGPRRSGHLRMRRPCLRAPAQPQRARLRDHWERGFKRTDEVLPRVTLPPSPHCGPPTG